MAQEPKRKSVKKAAKPTKAKRSVTEVKAQTSELSEVSEQPKAAIPTKAKKPVSESIAETNEPSTGFARPKVPQTSKPIKAKPKKATRSAADLAAQVSGQSAPQGEIEFTKSPSEPLTPLSTESTPVPIEPQAPAEPQFIDELQAAERANPTKRKPVSEKKTSQDASEPRKKKKKNKSRKRRHWWVWVPIIVVMLCLVGSCAVVGWDRWYRYDDTADFQDTWSDARTGHVVTIDETKMNLTEDVSYDYKLNTWDKYVDYSFATYSGNAMYVFSDDRATLYIVEGESRDIVQDVLRFVGLAELPDYLSKENATVLVKDASSLAPVEGEIAGTGVDDVNENNALSDANTSNEASPSE